MIGVLVFPGFQLLDASGAIAVFEIAARFASRHCEIRTIAVSPGPVSSSSGIELIARGLPFDSSLSTLVVTGGEGVGVARANAELLRFLQRSGERGLRIASVCNGAYLLAEAGLLDGRRATTHWSCATEFRQRFPNVKLEPDNIFTRDGNIWTSAGITAGIDLALSLVAEDHGDAVAYETARQLVLYRRRSGGQSQASPLLKLKFRSGRFTALLSWAREHLARPLTVEELADRAGMSLRNFARVFVAETGCTPSRAVEHLRMEVARERIEFSDEPIELVARSIGFRDPERMRRAFIRAYGHGPQTVRQLGRAREATGFEAGYAER